jgi:amino-acid N-acetyltransferase
VVDDVEIQFATGGELPILVGMLAAAGLPSGDITPASLEHFRVARLDSAIAGAIGLECYGHNGLMRSLVVAPESRGLGIGDALVSEIENHARTLRLTSLVLLTTTAGQFFRKRGYEVVSRDAMPASLQSSSEFSMLCPKTATCMHKVFPGAERELA